VTCTYCGTELPNDALFCGECGRAVSPATRRIERVQLPNVPPVRQVPPEPASPVVLQQPGVLYCENCGAAMEPDEVFCGECGAVSRSAAHNLSQPRDTSIIQRVEPVEIVPPDPDPDPEPEPEPEPNFVPAQEVQAAPEPPAPEGQFEPEPPAVPAAVLQRFEAPFADEADVEETRIFGHAALGERFVLQFSTGESSTVYGTGLIGRNPVPEPGEYFDQLVRVVDPSRSVSKAHLEFGQEAGSFWVMDRYSGNGTILREPEAAPIRCQPQRRYRVPRGTRVEIGEQFFIVS
jgi:predicted nucleic acid-binding Zn ribbon protein